MFTPSLYSQSLTRQEFHDSIKKMPSFSMYNDVYFITGIATNQPISKEFSDIKYQISFKQMVTKATLPFNSYLFVTYTQKAFWDVYKNSSPFGEINFNPAAGLGKPIFKDNGMIGLLEFKMEHESNGQDGLASRNWNRFSLTYNTALSKKMILSVEGWIPFTYKESNPDILDYVGLGEVKLEYTIIPEKLVADITLRKGLKDWNGAASTRLLYKLFNNSGNQYLMLEWFAGHSENLFDYNKYTSMIRLGYVIKSTQLNILRGK
ncbi:MAG: phospholipase A [Flavobacteriaceae bacterium]|nr:phospholipase A [Flavobacteriaceae bacterium]